MAPFKGNSSSAVTISEMAVPTGCLLVSQTVRGNDKLGW